MRKTNNENLQFIEEWARREETICKEKLQHLKMLCEVIEECDTHSYNCDEADLCIQETFIESEMCGDGETLQDVLSDNIYSRLQDVRDSGATTEAHENYVNGYKEDKNGIRSNI